MSAVDIQALAAARLGLSLDDGEATAARLAEMAGLSSPAREETRALLIEVFMEAVSAFPR